jgi:hypothetical protein
MTLETIVDEIGPHFAGRVQHSLRQLSDMQTVAGEPCLAKLVFRNKPSRYAITREGRPDVDALFDGGREPELPLGEDDDE